jgi:hypothetical protein
VFGGDRSERRSDATQRVACADAPPSPSARTSGVRTIEIDLWPLNRSLEISCGTMDHRPRPDSIDELVRCGDRC